MTRFARAKGSKASNERVLSEPTPWLEMKNQMLSRKQEIEEEKKRREAEAKRNENYQKFLNERKGETTSQTEWAEFPEEKQPKQNGVSKKSKIIKKQKNEAPKKNLKKNVALALEEVTDEIIPSSLMDVKKNKKSNDNLKLKSPNKRKYSGPERQESEKPKMKKINKLTNGTITQVNDEVKEINKISDNDNTDDGPMEISSKVELSEPVVKKVKKKKMQSKIPDLTKEKVKKINKISETDKADDTPMEISSKVEASEPVIKKVKKKKMQSKMPDFKNEQKKTDSSNKKEEKNKTPNQKRKDIDFDSLTEEEKKKVLKNREKRRKQMEKKKLKKEQNQSENKEENISSADLKQNKSITSNKNESSNSTFSKPKPWNKGPDNMKRPLKNQKTGEFKRRKDYQPNLIVVNGNEIQLEYFEGFQIKKEDAENLKKLKKEMISKGLPRSEINRTLKLERRKAEKALAREKKSVCFNCRKFGHNLSDCPLLSNKDELVDKAGAGICFKCGSTEHTSFACRVVHGESFKFATCFICKEQGHISRQCPDNARGLYPKGGSCRECGDVTHLKKDCPRYQEQQRKEEAKYQVGSIFDGNPEDIEPSKDLTKNTNRPKIIKF